MNIQDPIERRVAEVLDSAGVRYVHERENPEQRLDFYLPDFDIFIECKAYNSSRLEQQIKEKDVIVVQGRKAADAFAFIQLYKMIEEM